MIYSPETNLKKLIEIVEATPAEIIDLKEYRSQCGTLFCILGLAACDPFFQAQGVTFENRRFDQDIKVCLCVNGNAAWGHVDLHLDKLFGPRAVRLFEQRYHGCELSADFQEDQSITLAGHYLVDAGSNEVSDKQLALARLRWQLGRVTA